MSEAMEVALRMVGEQNRASPCRDCPVRIDGICASLDAEAFRALNRSAIRQRLEPGEHVLEQGSGMPAYLLVVSGVIKLTRMLADGRRQIVALRFANDQLGDPADGESYVSAEAVSEAEICRLPRHVIEQADASSEQFVQARRRLAARELEEARDWMVTLGQKNARERLAHLILLVARRLGRRVGGRVEFDIGMTRVDAAEFLGLTVETVSRQFTRLREDGVVVLHGKTRVIVPDMKRLAAEAAT